MKNNHIIPCVSVYFQPNTPSFPCSHFALVQTFLRLLSCDISVWKENPAQSFAATCYFLCVTSQKYSLSYWRPVQPVLCPSDVFTTLCPNPRLSLCQGKFCLLRHRQSVTSLCQSNSNTVCSDIYLICPMISSSHGCLEFISFRLKGKQGYGMWCNSFQTRHWKRILLRCTTGICYWSSTVLDWETPNPCIEEAELNVLLKGNIVNSSYWRKGY